MSGLYMLLGTLVAIGVLVTFHEFGHFWVARRCGVKVLRFSVGFGAPLLRWHDRQGTEFMIAAIPLGGYVKMLDEREAPVPAEQFDQAFNRKSVQQRIAIVAAGPVANFLLAIVFFWALALLGSEQVRPVVGSVVAGSLAAESGIQPGDEIIAVDGEDTPGWSAVNMQLISRLGETGALRMQVRPEGATALVERQLQLSDWLRGADEPDTLGSLGIVRWLPEGAPRITDLLDGGVAQQAGLRKGDELLSLGGELLNSPAQLVALTKSLAGETRELVYLRDGLQLSASLQFPSDPKVIAKSGYLGAVIAAPPIPPEMIRRVSYGPFEAVREGLWQTWSMSVLTLDSLGKMLLGELSVKNLSGPITIAKVAGASVQSGMADFLYFLAILSISLGVLNLLPIPVLDGGHLLFYLIEWARGRPLSERIQTWGVQIGISLVLGVMVLALVNDLSRL